jgi:hypothetical protein
VLEYTAAGCPPVLAYTSYNRPNCAKFNAHALDVIKAQDVKTVIMSARWVDLQRRGLDELAGTLATLSKLGVRTVVIGQSPMFATDAPIIAFRRGPSAGVASWPISFEPSLNRRLEAMAGRANFVDPIARLCRGTVCPYEANGQLLFLDDGHFSEAGSLLAVRAYLPVLTGLGAAAREEDGCARRGGVAAAAAPLQCR